MSADQNKNAPKDTPNAPPAPPIDKQVTDAIAKVCDAVRDLQPDNQRRVLSAAATVLGIASTNNAGRPAQGQQQRPNNNSNQRSNGGR